MKTLPLQAVRRDARGEYVFRIVEQAGEAVARYIPVKTGLQLGQRIQIVNGVESGDRIVSKGFLELRDGKQVVIQSASSQTLPAAAPKPSAKDQNS
jgi:hypothetical protein